MAQWQDMVELIKEHRWGDLVQAVGYVGIFAIVFIETGLLVGFALPGDTLLIAVGILCATGKMHLGTALISLFAGSFLGNNVGYWLGRLYGRKMLSKIPASYIDKAEDLIQRHGVLSTLGAPFIPVVRALVPFLSGTLNINYGRFLALTFVGSLIWTQGLTLVAYYVGGIIPDLEKYVYIVVALGLGAGLIPTVFKLLTGKKVGH